MCGAFISSNNNNNKAGCDMCRRRARRLVKNLRFNHNTEHDEVLQLSFKEEEEKGAARTKQTSITESFGTHRHHPSIKRERERERERKRESGATGNVHYHHWPWEIDSHPSRLQSECWCSDKGSSALWELQNAILLSFCTQCEYRVVSAIPAWV